MDCVGGKVLYEFFTSDMGEIPGICSRRSYRSTTSRVLTLANTDSGAKPIYLP